MMQLYSSHRVTQYMLSLSVTILLACSFVLMISCSHTSEPKSVELSGSLSLSGGIDNSGITIAVYTLDNSLTSRGELIDVASTLNVPLTQNRMFDHRNSDAAAYTQTDANGAFSLNVREGIYNIVIWKSGYGIRYSFNCNLTADKDISEFLDAGADTLLMDQVLGGVYETGTFVFAKNRNTVINTNTSFIGSSEVIVEPGAVVRIARDCSLNFNNSLTLQGEPDELIRIMVDEGVYTSTTISQLGFYDKLQILHEASTQDNRIDDLVFLDALNGIKIYQDSSVRTCTFVGGYETLMLNYADNVQVIHNLFINRNASETYSIDLALSNNLVFSDNILWKNNMGMQMTVTNDVLVENNYFDNPLMCVYLHHDGKAIFQYNTFRSGGRAVMSYITCNTEYYYNDIVADYGFDLGGTYNYGIANNNNLNCTSFAIKYISYRCGDMDAKNNYYYTTDPARLAQIIWDKGDFPSSYQWYDIMNYVLYQPYKSSPVPTAGIHSR